MQLPGTLSYWGAHCRSQRRVSANGILVCSPIARCSYATLVPPHRSSIARAAGRWAGRALTCTHTSAPRKPQTAHVYETYAYHHCSRLGRAQVSLLLSPTPPVQRRDCAGPRQHEAPPALNTRRLFVFESFYVRITRPHSHPLPAPSRNTPNAFTSTTFTFHHPSRCIHSYTHNQNPHDTADTNTTNTTTNHTHTQTKQKSVMDHGSRIMDHRSQI